MKAYLNAFKNYATFNGRTSRGGFWYFVLFNMIAAWVVSLLDMAFGTTMVFAGIYSLVVLLPGLAIAVRRLHDAGKSGWMLLVSLIPIIGYIWLLVLLCKGSQDANNQYGETQI